MDLTNRTLISVSRLRQAFGRCLVRRLSLHSGNGVGSQQRVTGLIRRRAGLPMMSVEVTVGPSMPRGARPDPGLVDACRRQAAMGITAARLVP